MPFVRHLFGGTEASRQGCGYQMTFVERHNGVSDGIPAGSCAARLLNDPTGQSIRILPGKPAPAPACTFTMTGRESAIRNTRSPRLAPLAESRSLNPSRSRRWPARGGGWSRTGGRWIKPARYDCLLLAESHLTRWLFAAMMVKIAALPSPAGSGGT
jgi:hypothetical protein